jgi:hypothetical protein
MASVDDHECAKQVQGASSRNPSMVLFPFLLTCWYVALVVVHKKGKTGNKTMTNNDTSKVKAMLLHLQLQK